MLKFLIFFIKLLFFLLIRERCELPNKISIEKNSSPARIVATLDDVFIRLQERLNRLFKSEDAIFKHESDEQNIVNKLNKQIKVKFNFNGYLYIVKNTLTLFILELRI